MPMMEGKDRRLCVKFPYSIQKSVDSMNIPVRHERVAEAFKPEAEENFKRDVCAQCMGCKHREVETRAFNDPRRDSLMIEAQTFCSKVGARGDKGTLDPFCPDGFQVHKHEWANPADVNLTPFSTVTFMEKPGREHGLVVLRSAPYNAKFQHHKTVRELDQESRRTFTELMAVSGSRGHSVEEIKRMIQVTESEEREDFFRTPTGRMGMTPDGFELKDKGGSVRVSMGMINEDHLNQAFTGSKAKFDAEYQLHPRGADDGKSDVPQSPDTGTW